MPCLEMLRTILLNGLVHCRSFHIYRDYEHEDEYAVDWVEPSDAVAIILTIIAETALPIKSFHLDFTEFGALMTLDTKRVRIPGFPEPPSSRFRSGWDHLEELILAITLSAESLSLVTELVLSAPHLQKLKLGNSFSDGEDSSELFFKRLSIVEGLPALHEMSLSAVRMTGPTLTRFIHRFGSSLCTLSFWFVSLNSQDTWAAFFRAMRGSFPLLEQISVQHLRETTMSYRIIFPLLGKDREVPETGGRKFNLKYRSFRRRHTVIGAEYSGPGIDMALELLARSAIVLDSMPE